MDISIIIPVLNEAAKIEADIKAAVEFFSAHQLRGEFIIVDDGSTDGTAAVADSIEIPEHVTRHVIRTAHRGKGHAVKAGMLKSAGNIILFIDSGGCIAYSDVVRGIRLIENNKTDIAHASRRLPDSVIVRQHLQSRQITSFLFRKFMTVIMRVPPFLTDTQCGLKIYRGDLGRALYAELLTDGFMFDIEIILRAVKRKMRIREFPITWRADLDSRLSQMKMPTHIVMALLKIKQALAKDA